MGIRIARKKPRNLTLTLLYRLHRLLPMGTRAKLKWYLDLEWTFDRLAMEMAFKHYPAGTHPFRLKAFAFLLPRIRPEDVVLDLGCNTGDVSVAVASKAKEVVGVDHDGNAIAKACELHRLPNLSFHHGDALEHLQANTKRYDVLVLSHILEHLDDPGAFLRAFKDFFQRIYIELPDFDRTYLNLYRQEVGATLIYTDDDHISEFDRDELRALLEECGIRITEAEYRFGVQRLWCEVLK